MLTRVSRLTGTALRQVQNWGALGWALGTALVAAGLSWTVVEALLAGQGAFVRVVAGTAVLGAAYLAMNFRKLIR